MGLTMAAAIALCVLSSAYLFGRIEPLVSDFTGYEQNTPVPAVVEASDDEPAEPENGGDAPEPTEEAVDEPAQVDNQPAAGPNETATTTSFEQTHESNPDFTVNFRPGPSINSGEPVATLDPGTPLQYLDEQTTGDDGSIWLRMRTADGIEGWLREVDTIQVS
ncbi:MAG: SH3 domain-containing protein [Thermomicrobiales bacterium]|nr:SH3 domain-containing protein [Thermomicrobiales bacterium]